MIPTVRRFIHSPIPAQSNRQPYPLPDPSHPSDASVPIAAGDESVPCIHHWFEAQVAKTPDAIALSFKGQHLTYASLNQRANQLAHYLLQQGLQPEELVIISMHRSLEMVIGFLGVLKAGGAYVPVDPTYPVERQAHQFQDVQTRFILTQQNLVEALPQHTATVICLDGDGSTLSSFSDANPDVDIALRSGVRTLF